MEYADVHRSRILPLSSATPYTSADMGHARNEPDRKKIPSTAQYSSHHRQCLTVLASIPGIKSLLRFNPEATKAFVLGAN